jgi:hypothetical protein
MNSAVDILNHYTIVFDQTMLQTPVRSVQCVPELQQLLVACYLFPSPSVADAVIRIL